jgi:hypothetical protein
MKTKKLIAPSRSIRRIYLVLYDQQEFFGYDTTSPVKAFKTKKMAEIYASSRNFEFQSVCMLEEEDYEAYVLGITNSDYIVSISDFRDANSFIREESLRLEKNKIPFNIWTLLDDIKPFKVVPVEYVVDSKNI